MNKQTPKNVGSLEPIKVLEEKKEIAPKVPSEGRTRTAKPKASVLKSAEKATEMATPGKYLLKGLLTGPSGSGKRMSATTLPGKILLIDYDGRKETVAGLEHVDVISCYDPNPQSPTAWRKAETLKQEIWASIRKGTFPYDAIVEATLSSMLRYCMNWSLLLDPKRGLGGAPAKQHYLPQMKNIGDHVLSLKSAPVHYILTAHIEIIEDEDMGGLKYLPKATGKMRTEIPGWFNECYYCHRHPDENGKLRYYWTTAGTGRWDFLKSTLNQLGRYWSDPIEIDFDKPPVGFKKLLLKRFPDGKGERDGHNKV